MNKFKKQLFISITYVFSILLLLNTVVFSAAPEYENLEREHIENWKSLPLREDVDENKVWKINFKSLVYKSKINDSSIFILDDCYNKVETEVALSDDYKQVEISPINNYKPSHSYVLYVLDKADSSNIKKGICMPFTINSNATKIDESFNNQSITLKKGETLQLTLPDDGYDGGYSWQSVSTGSSIIKNTEHINIIYSLYPQACPGAGLRDRWLFQAINTGKTSIQFKYSREWDSNSTINTFKLSVNVK
ncbi:protease inhibitor I42 family protein [Clostridium kluyveri]|uniref:Proteinase inhibitor I42 chagasin domain-containing protein n=1 Tax=Clostridium kluyveri TaxID=1534 RepID=A0A1L5FA25_CLOKL|nr:protease inhibitor I42 family protein [Clostridium kluyveri]APM39849.1 hypothetical protein BS101_14460 [Clostridium kluyveri]